MGMTYRHLTLRERQLIFRMLDKKASMRAIAEKLGKHISTIYREIKRNWFDDMDPWLDGLKWLGLFGQVNRFYKWMTAGFTPQPGLVGAG